jgi:hypothetical protein
MANKNDPYKANKYAAKSDKYFAKSEAQAKKITKLESKFKHDKWDVKSEKFARRAQAAKIKVESNERIMQTYKKTIKAMDEGTIQQGKLFMRYVTD